MYLTLQAMNARTKDVHAARKARAAADALRVAAAAADVAAAQWLKAAAEGDSPDMAEYGRRARAAQSNAEDYRYAAGVADRTADRT